MIYLYFLLFNILSLSIAKVSLDSSIRCNCDELNRNDCADASLPCAWSDSDSACVKVELKCSIMGTKSLCEEFVNCRWSDNSCEQFDPECSDFTTAARCPSILDCYWNREGKCFGFTKCSDYDLAHCPTDQFCQKTSSSCTDYSYIQCSAQTKSTCNGYASKTDYCAWKDDNTCSPVNLTTLQCSDLNDFTLLCNSTTLCVHDGTTCRIAKCSDRKSILQCVSTQVTNTEYVLCAWDNGVCSDADDTSQLTSENCYLRTKGNYKWSDGKCEQCDDHFSIGDSTSYSMLVFGALILFILGA